MAIRLCWFNQLSSCSKTSLKISLTGHLTSKLNCKTVPITSSLESSLRFPLHLLPSMVFLCCPTKFPFHRPSKLRHFNSVFELTLCLLKYTVEICQFHRILITTGFSFCFFPGLLFLSCHRTPTSNIQTSTYYRVDRI